MTLKELRDKISKLMRDAQAILLKPSVTSEERASVDAMLKDVDELEAQAAQLERVEKWEAEQRQVNRPPRPNPGSENQETEEERKASDRKALLQYFRGGLGNVEPELRGRLRPFIPAAGEQRDITTSSGAQLVPQLFYTVLIEALKYYAPLMDLVTLKRTQNNGAPMKYATDNDTANSITVLGEGTAASEVDPTFSGSLLSTDTATTGLIKISEQELADSYFDLDAYVRNRFGKRLGRGFESWIINGNSSNVASLLSGAHVGATSDAPTAISYADITALYTALDPAYEANATWLMNSATRGLILAVTDTLGRPLFVPNPSSGAFDMLLGRPVKLAQSLPNVAATTKSLVYGDLEQGYLFRVDGDLAIKRLNERFADALEVGFIGYLRCGGVSTDAGTHPIQILQQHA